MQPIRPHAMFLLRCSARAISYQAQVRPKLQRRCISSLRSHRKVSEPEKFIVGGTWHAPDPSKVQPVDFLDCLQDLRHYQPAKVDRAVVLVTPSFTHWLNEDNGFLARLAHRIRFQNASGRPNLPQFTIQTRSAVVDSVPTDTNLTMRSQTSSRGVEGISILVSGSGLRSLAHEPTPPDASSRNAHIRFVAQIAGHEHHIVGLPVANTMFRNGRDSTIFEDTWGSTGELKDGSRFQRLSRQPLKSFDIAITPPSSSTYVGIPIAPLTRPYAIASSIGNVIRELKRADTGELFPASTDLEAAVPQFLKSPWLTEEAKKTFSVFALITHQDFYAKASDAVVTGIHSPARRFLLPELFRGGARLHRVTGGGGGWGKKKGLLSLEPGRDVFANEHDELPMLPSEGETYDFPGTSALAAPGDNIQFFATLSGPQSPTEDSSYVEKEAATVDGWRKKPQSEHPRVVIGTTTSDEHYSTSTWDAAPTGNRLLFMPSFFGMLSESGICLGSASIFASPPGIDGPASFTSRLDIPFTTLLAEAISKYGYTSPVRRVLPKADKP